MSTFIEEDCTISHNGQKFTSGGAWLCDCSDGYRRGVVYAKPESPIPARPGSITGPNPSYPCRGSVTDWHGNVIAVAYFGHPYHGGFGAKMRCVSFTLDGVYYAGRYGYRWSDAVRVRSTKKVVKR